MISIESIFELLNSTNYSYSYIGSLSLMIQSFSPIEEVRSNFISWMKNDQKIQAIKDKSIENTLIVCKEIDTSQFKDGNFIVCENPKAVFFTILNHFFYKEPLNEYISPSSIVETNQIGKYVYIGHNTHIGPDVVISDNVKIKDHVCIEGKVFIGKNTIIHSGVVIGTDGFGYFKSDAVEHVRVPHFGGVMIGDNVEIGANTCIDKGTLSDTKIGNNVKINNLCHIAHNVVIEENVLISASATIAGSAHIKKNVNIAPSAVIRNQLSVGENSFIGMGSVVVKDVPDSVVVAGVPAKTIKKLEVT